MKSKGAKEIALSGISAAFALIAMAGAVYIKFSTVTMFVLAGVFTMLPLTKGYWKGSIMCFIVVSILGFLMGNIRSLPYIIFFGIFAIFQWVIDIIVIGNHKLDKIPKWTKIAVGYLVKLGVLQLSIYLLWLTAHIIFAEMNIFGLEIKYWMVAVFGMPLYVAYDVLMHFVFVNLKKFIDKRIK